MTDQDIQAKFDEGSAQFREIRGLLNELRTDVRAAKKSSENTKEIVEAWLALKKAGGFLRWLGGVLASAMAVYLALRGILHK